MEFITVEQFKEQAKEIQKVFLDWWNPSIGDIYSFIDIEEYANDMSVIQLLSSRIQTKIANNCKEEGNRIPLFTEGQLRKFIEDKTNGLLDVECNDLNDDYYFYTIRIFEIKELEYGKEFGEILIEEYIECEDLLQAYWKVACIVAKEQLN